MLLTPSHVKGRRGLFLKHSPNHSSKSDEYLKKEARLLFRLGASVMRNNGLHMRPLYLKMLYALNCTLENTIYLYPLLHFTYLDKYYCVSARGGKGLGPSCVRAFFPFARRVIFICCERKILNSFFCALLAKS